MDDDLKGRLLKARVSEDDVEIDGIGTVRVRGLTRAEVFGTQQLKGIDAQERKIVALGMVDPPMTEAEVGQWQANSPGGEMEPVVGKISELSGLSAKSAKEAMSDFRDESDAGV